MNAAEVQTLQHVRAALDEQLLQHLPLSRLEQARVVAVRAQQLEAGAPCLLPAVPDVWDPCTVAAEELQRGALQGILSVVRYRQGGATQRIGACAHQRDQDPGVQQQHPGAAYAAAAQQLCTTVSKAPVQVITPGAQGGGGGHGPPQTATFTAQ